MAMIFPSSTHQLSSFSRATLRHLQNLYPLDEFTIERCLSAHGKHLVYLKQRNVSLHDEPFLDLVVNSDGCVVGIQVFTFKGDVGRGVVLIKKNGALCNVDHDGEVVTVLTDTIRFKQYYQIGGCGGSSCCPPGFSVCGEGCSVHHPKLRNCQIHNGHKSKLSDPKLSALVQAHKDKGPWMLKEYERYLRGSPVPCHMRKYHTMATRSKVPHIEDWKLLPFGKKCSICKAFLCKGKKNKRNCALYEE